MVFLNSKIPMKFVVPLRHPLCDLAKFPKKFASLGGIWKILGITKTPFSFMIWYCSKGVFVLVPSLFEWLSFIVIVDIWPASHKKKVILTSK
jgi:hypothetical protein